MTQKKKTLVAIPATMREVKARVASLTSLHSATGWELAAIVYACTDPQQGKRTSSEITGGCLTVSEFAALGIRGLRSDQTVRRYRRAWETAVEQGWAKPSYMGEPVHLPLEDFPGDSARDGASGIQRAQHRVASDIRKPGVLDETADEVIEALGHAKPETVTKIIQSPEIVKAVNERVAREKAKAEAEWQAERAREAAKPGPNTADRKAIHAETVESFAPLMAALNELGSVKGAEIVELAEELAGLLRVSNLSPEEWAQVVPALDVVTCERIAIEFRMEAANG